MGFPVDGGCHVSYTGIMIIVSTMFVDGIVPCTLMIEFEDLKKKRDCELQSLLLFCPYVIRHNFQWGSL
jgi:hypothetical protein